MLDQRQENTSPSAPLYKELPYPADGVLRTAHARILAAGLEQHATKIPQRRPLRIVDVGCGTGECTVGLTKIFPQAEITGVDINPASLELAQGLAKRVGAQVRFLQCDISANLVERLRALVSGGFDVVCSLGVLHHLADPRVGFSAVRQIVHPEGFFYCFVYSHFGRREEMAIKSLLTEMLPAGSTWNDRADALGKLRLTNLHTLFNSLKRIGHRIKHGPPLLPLELIRAVMNRNNLVHESDTYSNPCEHLYRFGELRTLLTDTGWDLVGLARHAGLPTTPREHTRRRGELELLEKLPVDARYDYFAFYYEASGFNFFCRPGGA